MRLLKRNDDPQARTGVLVAVGLLVLVFGFAVAVPALAPPSNPVWFIGLLVIFGGSLALIAVVFRWLGLQAAGEAFGLPAGSIRTMLAVGVMVLFTVFGLAAIANDQEALRPAATPLLPQPVAVDGDAKTVRAAIDDYRKVNVAALPVSLSASGAQLMLYRLENFKSPEALDLQKQIVTALLTLLASVVSFYFGSRSSEQARDAAGKAADALKSPGSAATEIERLDTRLADLRTRFTALQSEPPAEGNDAALVASLDQARADLRAAESSRSQVASAMDDLSIDAGSAGAVGSAVMALKAALTSLSQRLARAEALTAKG